MDQVDQYGRQFTLIHLVFPLSNESPAEWRVACMPNMVELHRTNHHQHHQRTDSWQAVTCPACKRSDVYRAAAQRDGAHLPQPSPPIQTQKVARQPSAPPRPAQPTVAGDEK